MDQLAYLDEIYEKYLQIVHANIPEECITNSGFSGSSFHIGLSESNKGFEGGNYYYNGPYEFIHWTSLNALMSIVNSRKIRLYNLHNSSDENEFKYAAEALKIPGESIEYSKDKLFTWSFCEGKEITNENMWKEYGREHQGVAFQFEVTNSPVGWKNYMISQIYYNLPQNLIKLKRDLSVLIKEYPGTQTQMDLSKLLGFHKRDDFQKEKEVRLSIYSPYQSLEAYWKLARTEFKIANGRNRITNYIELPLWVNNSNWVYNTNSSPIDRRLKLPDDHFKVNPKIKLKSIYFGKNIPLSSEEYLQFRDRIIRIVKNNYGYNIYMPYNKGEY